MVYLLLFVEGILTFLSPCIIPMLPLYLSYIGATSDSKSTNLQRTAIFLLGFGLVFIILSLMINTVSRFLVQEQDTLNLIAGGLLTLVGIDLFFDNRFSSRIFRPLNITMNKMGPFTVGILFGITWTPCVGAFLASVISLSLTADNVLGSAVMLLTYILGLAVPFMISGVLLDQTRDFIASNQALLAKINRYSALALIVVGILLASGYLYSFLYI